MPATKSGKIRHCPPNAATVEPIAPTISAWVSPIRRPWRREWAASGMAVMRGTERERRRSPCRPADPSRADRRRGARRRRPSRRPPPAREPGPVAGTSVCGVAGPPHRSALRRVARSPQSLSSRVVAGRSSAAHGLCSRPSPPGRTPNRRSPRGHALRSATVYDAAATMQHAVRTWLPTTHSVRNVDQ